MEREGIAYDNFFEEYFFLGNHENVIEALMAGSIDAGAVYNDVIIQASNIHGDIFKVILESPPIPSVGVVVHPDVPQEVQQRLQAAFLALKPADIEAIYGETDVAGYAVEPDSFYDLIRDIWKRRSKNNASILKSE